MAKAKKKAKKTSGKRVVAAGRVPKNLSKTVRARKAKSNPGPAAHEKTGTTYLRDSERLWKRYRKSRKTDHLLDAYESLVMAYQELEHSDDVKGLEQARLGMTQARAELRDLFEG